MKADLSNHPGPVALSPARAVLRRASIGAALAAAVAAQPLVTPSLRLQAQSFTVSGLAARADTPLLDDMLGGALTFETPIRRGPVYMRFGASRLSASGASFGAPCGGLILPGACPPEDLQTTGAITSGTLGIRALVADRANVEVHIMGDGIIGTASTRLQGTTTSRTLSFSEGVLGVAGGASVQWFPGMGSWGARLGATYSRFLLTNRQGCTDCFVPFGEGFGATQVSLGVTYRRVR